MYSIDYKVKCLSWVIYHYFDKTCSLETWDLVYAFSIRKLCILVRPACFYLNFFKHRMPINLSLNLPCVYDETVVWSLFVLLDDIYLFSEVSLPSIYTTHGTPQILCRPLLSASSASTTPNPWWTTLKQVVSTLKGWSRSTSNSRATEDSDFWPPYHPHTMGMGMEWLTPQRSSSPGATRQHRLYQAVLLPVVTGVEVFCWTLAIRSIRDQVEYSNKNSN